MALQNRRGHLPAGSSVAVISEELHEFFAKFSLLLVFIHVLGVIIESFIHRENLVTAMINGRKVSSPDQDQSRGSQP